MLGAGHLLHLIHLVAALALVTFGWRVSVAYLTPCLHGAAVDTSSAHEEKRDGCCPGPEREERSDDASAHAVGGDGDEEDGDCSCPIDCSPCCGGAILHALPAVTPPPIVAIAVLADLPAPELSTHRALADPAGILHVPRAC